MCQTCYASFIKLDELEAKERVAKLLSIYEHQKKRRNIMKIFSFLIPGAAQLYAGKICRGIFFPLAFSLLAVPAFYEHDIRPGRGALYAQFFCLGRCLFGSPDIYFF